MTPDERTLTQAAIGASGNIETGLEFEVAQLIRGNDPAAAYAADFIGRIALTSESFAFDTGEKFRRAWPKDFKVREWARRIRATRQEIDAANAAAASTRLGAWAALLLTSESGAPKPLLANAITALRHAPEWSGVLAFDEFSVRTVKRARPPFTSADGWWTDHDDIMTADWLQHRGIGVPVSIAADAIQAVAQLAAFHPVRDWLSSLQWDGHPRIEGFLEDYFGCEDSAYGRTVGSKWLVSAVARIMRPGCQADHTLVLEGLEGIRKSSGLRALAGDQWFTDDIGEIGDKDTVMQLNGRWIVELGELDAMRRSDTRRVWAFLTRREDHYRPPYGRRTADFSRQCVFSASTNEQAYISTPEGARRLWPVRCIRVDLPGIVRDRDQIWAEAVARYQAGADWWIEDEAMLAAAREQRAMRFQVDPWDAMIWEWVLTEQRGWADADHSFNRRRMEYSVSVAEILSGCLKKKPDAWTQMDKERIGRILRAHGLEAFKQKMYDTSDRPIVSPAGAHQSEWRFRFRA